MGFNVEYVDGSPLVEPFKGDAPCCILVCSRDGRWAQWSRCSRKATFLIDGKYHVCGIHRRKALSGTLSEIIVGESRSAKSFTTDFKTKTVIWKGTIQDENEKRIDGLISQWKLRIDSMHSDCLNVLAALYGVSVSEIRKLLPDKRAEIDLKRDGISDFSIKVGCADGRSVSFFKREFRYVSIPDKGDD